MHSNSYKPSSGNSERTDYQGGMERSFGFKEVNPGEKQPLVNEVFHSVAKQYDIMNDLMSGGLHRIWKNSMIAWLAPPANSNWHSLDVAGGTGDIAFRIIKASQKKARTTILDINSSMLEVGKQRAINKGLIDNLQFVEANAERLPFPDNHFNAYTIAFGIRNVPNIKQALAEAYRVLKPGGRFLCLEFSQVKLPMLDKIYNYWSFNAIPKIGELITGDMDAYQYLVESIRKFPNQQDFATLIQQANFSHVSYRNLTNGVVAMHSGWKLSC